MCAPGDIRMFGRRTLKYKTQEAMQQWADQMPWTLPPGNYTFRVRGQRVRLKDAKGRLRGEGPIHTLPPEMMYCEGTLLLTPQTTNPIHE